MLLIEPHTGAKVDAAEELAWRYIACGFKAADAEKPEAPEAEKKRGAKKK